VSAHSEADDRQHVDAGSAVVDFVLVGMLTTLLFASVLQLALALHVRSTLIDCAAEGARYGALADRTPADGASRAAELIRVSLDASFAQDVHAAVVVEDGLELVEVEVSAPLPVLGLLGPAALTVAGHALREPA
jgi:hypothetical protein